jgi:tetratricopeptide (TPR) repeat protein
MAIIEVCELIPVRQPNVDPLPGECIVPKFAYNAIDKAGKEQYGVVEGENQADALNELSRLGLYPTDVRPANVTDDWRVGRRDALEAKQAHDERVQKRAKKRHHRQRLVVRYADGRTAYGVSFALNLKDAGFHLDQTDKLGVTENKSIQVDFEDLKAVFYVKSFDGKYDKTEQFREWAPEGSEVVVEFHDGESIHGSTQHAYNPHDIRFHLVPIEPDTNNISILVEAKALKGVFTPEEYKAKKSEEKQVRKEQKGADVTQEETMGDFYFETRNYKAAQEQYETALAQFPQSHRLRKKKLAAFFNIGVQHIKQRNYPEALEVIEEVLRLDPTNSHAQKKVHQLRKIVAKSKKS